MPYRWIEPRWLSADAAAEYIGVTAAGLRRLANEGRVPAPNYHLGPRQPRWDRPAIDEAISEAMGAGKDSTHTRVVFQAIAGSIVEEGISR